MDDYYNILPENADKLLFAEDLVSYVMADVFFAPYEGTRATPYRGLIRCAFKDSIKTAVNEIANHSLRVDYRFYDQVGNIAEPEERHFLGLIEEFKLKLLPDGLDPKAFLFYSTYVSMTGAVFHRNGLGSALDMAVNAIFDYIKDYDMTATGWKSLTAYASVSHNLCRDSANVLTPDSLYLHSSSSPEDENYQLVWSDDKEEEIESNHAAESNVQGNLTDSEHNQVDENGATIRDFESPCVTKSNETVQPRKSFGDAVKDTTVKTALIPMDNPFAAAETEYGKLLTPDSEEDRALNTVENKNIRSPTTSKADTKGCSAQRKGTPLNEGIIGDEYEELTKEECAIAKPEGKSKPNIHSQASSSKSSLQKDKSDYHVDSQCKSFEITSSKNSVREKRLSDLDFPDSTEDRVLNTIENKNIRTPTTSKSDTKEYYTQRKGTPLNEGIIGDEYEEFAKEECAIAKPGDRSKPNIHPQASSSKSSLQKDKSDCHVDSQCKSFEITSSKNSVREKRLSDLDLRQNNEKKLKNSNLH